MKAKRTYQVKDVSRIARISVRTLHYYEEIGLLVPTGRTDAGYRLYTDDDLLRLQQILIRRELGLPLEQIRRSLDDPAFDCRQALLAQKQQLLERVAAIDAALEGDMEKMFEGFDQSKYGVEALADGMNAHAPGLAAFLVAAIRSNASHRDH